MEDLEQKAKDSFFNKLSRLALLFFFSFISLTARAEDSSKPSCYDIADQQYEKEKMKFEESRESYRHRICECNSRECPPVFLEGFGTKFGARGGFGVLSDYFSASINPYFSVDYYLSQFIKGGVEIEGIFQGTAAEKVDKDFMLTKEEMGLNVSPLIRFYYYRFRPAATWWLKGYMGYQSDSIPSGWEQRGFSFGPTFQVLWHNNTLKKKGEDGLVNTLHYSEYAYGGTLRWELIDGLIGLGFRSSLCLTGVVTRENAYNIMLKIGLLDVGIDRFVLFESFESGHL